MTGADLHRVKLDRFVRRWTTTLAYVVTIVALGGLVDAVGLA